MCRFSDAGNGGTIHMRRRPGRVDEDVAILIPHSPGCAALDERDHSSSSSTGSGSSGSPAGSLSIAGSAISRDLVLSTPGRRPAPWHLPPSFALHRFADFENADGSTAIAIRCRWRNTRKPFPIPRYVRVKTTVKEVRNLMEASLTGKA